MTTQDTTLPPLPELLEALEAMLEVHGVTQAYADKHIEIPQSWVEVSNVARAAIAKAGGAAQAPQPTCVWSVESKTFRALYATKADAEKFVASLPITVSGGMSVSAAPVIGAQQAQGVPQDARKLLHIAQLAAAPQAVQKESHAELDLHSNPARDEQQRQLASALEVGQPLGFGQDESASNSQPKGAIARISGMDEYGPMLEWYTHWANFKIGTEIYAAAPQAEPALDKTRNHLSTMIGLVLGARQRGAAYEAGSAIDKAVQEAIGHLKNWPQAPAVEAEPQPEREPLTDEQWLKRWTAVSGQQLKPGLQRMSLLSTLRFAERVYGIGTKGGDK